MEYQPAPLIGDHQREQRIAKLLVLALSSAREERARIVVRNLSPHGLGARGDIDLLACERVTVHLPGGRDVAATVRWARKGSFGLALDERIEPDALQTRAVASPTELRSRDDAPGFEPLRVAPQQARRSGFQRSHRDQVLSDSGFAGGGVSDWLDRG